MEINIVGKFNVVNMKRVDFLLFLSIVFITVSDLLPLTIGKVLKVSHMYKSLVVIPCYAQECMEKKLVKDLEM